MRYVRAWLAVGGVFLALTAGAPSRLAAQPAPPVPQATIAAFDALFRGPYPAARAVHANGIVVTGDFTPTPEAAGISRAPHFAGGSVAIVVRFSNFAAVPDLPDGAPDASPRGMAIKFMLPDGVETDIVAHSYDGFPAATPDDFLSFLQATADPVRLASLAARKPAVSAFLADPKPAPASYATEQFFGVTAFRFTNAAGTPRLGRYRLVPQAGIQHLTAAQAATQPASYLHDELAQRLAMGAIRFQLILQLAAEGDDEADGSTPWPDTRPLVPLGTVALRALAADAPETGRTLRFVPTNLVSGISPSRDPMLLARTRAYRISAERRGAEE